MKKVGIVTFHKALNYGAFLQAFALQEFLKKEYKVTIIDYENKKIKKDYKVIKTTSIKEMIKSFLYLSKTIKRKKVFLKCIKRNLNLGKIKDNFDIVIAGSDQIWNLNLTGGYDDIYSLEKFSNVKRISYASSIGEESIISKNKNEYQKIMANIDEISVREEKAKKELEKLTDKKIKVNLDPTMLLEKKNWLKYTTNISNKEKYIFSYFVAVTQENYDALAKISNKMKLKTISYSKRVKEKNVYKDCYTDNPFEFISRIKEAEIIFTSSFHATVFAIIFNKKFYCMPPKGKENRILDLLSKLELNSRIITKLEDIDRIDLYEKINYEEVNKKLAELRKDSKNWLLSNLEEK